MDPKEVRRAFIGSSQEVIGGHRRLIAGLQGVHKWFIGSSCGVHIPLISFQAPWVALGIQVSIIKLYLKVICTYVPHRAAGQAVLSRKCVVALKIDKNMCRIRFCKQL